MVIIQALRESGVLSSVISSASTTLSREKFLATIDSSNSSRAAASISLPSRQVDRSRQHQASGRKVLNVEASRSHEAAVPPLPPPEMDNSQLLI